MLHAGAWQEHNNGCMNFSSAERLSCSHCNYAAQFESALNMHHQLHHDSMGMKGPALFKKCNTVPRVNTPSLLQRIESKKDGLKLATASSATRLFDRLRAKVCKSRQTLFVHQEETTPDRSIDMMEQEPPLSVVSDCTSKALTPAHMKNTSSCMKKESYACHLCQFDSDRITDLDRHLLNHHKISLENLLKLVLAKTKEGLSEDQNSEDFFRSRQPYYTPEPEDAVETETGKEFVVETTYPKIKILRHASIVTDLKMNDVVDRGDHCECNQDNSKDGKEDLVTKISTLNDCMCRFVDSSNTLKRVLNNELDSKHSMRTNQLVESPMFHLKLSDDTPREYRRTQSDKVEKIKCCNKYCRSARSTFASDSSFYF